MKASKKKRAESGLSPAEETGGTPLDPVETARYIAEITVGLRTVARRAKLKFLAYLLDMVAMEALDRSGMPEKPPHSDVSRTR
ncbi:MAG: hypothetical protein AB7S41_05965 [Parvibaculaceae bacterium]